MVVNELSELNVIRTEKKVILMITEDSCIVTNNFMKSFDGYSNQYNNIYFAKVNLNIDNNKLLINQFNLKKIPTFILYVNGQEKKRYNCQMGLILVCLYIRLKI
ncbi:hypothetical protein ACTFIR_009708 [Dictyostelium discoideum]